MNPILKVLIVVFMAFHVFNPLLATTYTINPTTLNSYTGVHPRLYMDSSTIGTLKSNITAYQTGAPRWGEMWIAYKKRPELLSLQTPTPFTSDPDEPQQAWQRDVGDNIVELSMAYLLTKGTTPSSETFWWEAEDAVVSAPMAVTSDQAASSGACIGTPTTGTTNNPNTQPPSATYYFSAHTTSAFRLWVRAYTPDTRVINAWVTVDGVETRVATAGSSGSWIWVSCGYYHLTPGSHVMNLTYYGPGVRFDKMCMSTDFTLTPTGLGTEQHWLDAQNFTLNSNGVAPNPNNLVVTASNGIQTSGDFQSLSGKWLEAWSGEANNTTTPAATATPDAQQTVGLNGGNYDVWARFKANETNNDSFFFAIDTLGYSGVVLDGTTPYPYNTLVSPTLLAHQPRTGLILAAPYNSYAYREWVWKKIANNVALGAGNHTFKICQEGGTMNIAWNGQPINCLAGCQIDRLAVLPAGTAAPLDPNKYLNSAYKWALTSCSYPTWGIAPYAGDDLGAAHQLRGLGLIYDWLYSNLGLTDRTTIANTLSTRGAAMNAGMPTAWYYNAVMQNHCSVCTTGLTTAALAIYGDAGMPDTTPWLNTALGRINAIVNDVGSDGAWHEGVAYCGYFLDFLLQYQDMANKMLGFDISGTPWLSQTANYRLYFDLPKHSQVATNNHINFADDRGYDWNGPNYFMRRLASLYNLPTAQWLAGHYDAGKLNAGFLWWNFFWYNPSIPETSPVSAGIATSKFFDDLDFAVLRSGWDGDESVVAYQSGPFMGHGVQAKDVNPWKNWGGNHAHAAVGNFCIFGYGTWLILNDGYANNRKTNQSNTLLINNAGQLGEGTSEFNSGAVKNEDPGGVLNPVIDDALTYSTPNLDYVVGNATSCYSATNGLTKFRRHMLYLKPDVLVVVDDVVLSASKPLELHFYPPNLAPVLSGNTSTTMATNGSKIALSLLTPAQSVISTPVITWSGAGGNHYCCKVTPTAGSSANWSNAMAMAWSPTGSSPKAVTMLTDSDGGAWKFKVGTQTAILNRNAGHAPDEKALAVTTLETESVARNAPMQSYSDATASGGSYIATPTGTTPNIPDTLTSPSVSYSFSVPTAGTYSVWARVKAVDSSSNSFHYAVNPAGAGGYALRSTVTYGSWVWVNLTSSASLSAGANVVALKYAAANCKIDQVIVSPDTAYVPYGMY